MCDSQGGDGRAALRVAMYPRDGYFFLPLEGKPISSICKSIARLGLLDSGLVVTGSINKKMTRSKGSGVAKSSSNLTVEKSGTSSVSAQPQCHQRHFCTGQKTELWTASTRNSQNPGRTSLLGQLVQPHLLRITGPWCPQTPL